MQVRLADFLIVLGVGAAISGLLFGNKLLIDLFMPIDTSHAASVASAAAPSFDEKKLSSILSYNARLQAGLARHHDVRANMFRGRSHETVYDWGSAYADYVNAVHAMEADQKAGNRTSMDTAIMSHLHSYIAKTMQRRDQNEAALTNINIALRFDSEDKMLFEQRAEILHALGRESEAARDLAKAKSMDWTVTK